MSDPQPEDEFARILDRFVTDLRRIPELFRQLDVTITRTDAVRPRGEGSSSGHDQPLLLNDRASDARRLLLVTLRQAAASVPYAPEALTPRDAALDILEALPATLRLSWAAEWMLYVGSAITAAWGVCDVPDTKLGGLCPTCDAPIYGPRRIRYLKCRACGTEIDAGEHRAWMRDVVAEQTGTATELARLLPAIEGERVQASTIRQWVARGRLTPVPPQDDAKDDGVPRYRLGDVLTLARKRARRTLTVGGPAVSRRVA